MSIQRYRNDNPRTSSEIADAIEAELQSIKPSAPAVRGTENYAFIQAMAATLSAQQEQSLNELYDAAYITDATGEELTKAARSIGVDRNEAIPSTGVAEFTRSSPASTTRTVPSGTRVSTGGEDGIIFETTEKATLQGPTSNTDTTLYTTTSTSFVTKRAVTVDTTYRQSLDVSADISNSNSNYTTYLDIVDTTNSVTIASYSTTNTSLTSKGPTSYDISSLSGDIDIEFQLRTSNSSGTAEMDNSDVSPGGETGDTANIECTENGNVGNVGANTITNFIDAPSGIESVTNPNPTGDPTYTLTNGTTPLITGSDRETDAELRERTLESTAIGGAGTAEATELALENIDDVVSADVFTNRSDSTVNGVSPWHTEIRVYGGNVNDIALRLYEVLPLSVLKTLEGGVNGTLDSATLTLSDLYGDLQIDITRPTETTLAIDIDIVHDASYAGTNAAKNAIVRYVGGTITDARTVTGLGQGENVLVNGVENVVEDVNGVDYANVTLVDSDGDGTDDTTTDSDGIPVYSVSESEVAIANASDINPSETAR